MHLFSAMSEAASAMQAGQEGAVVVAVRSEVVVEIKQVAVGEEE